jgi:hypothetical protein
MGSHKEKVIDDVTLKTDYSSLQVITPEFVIDITGRKFRLERNVANLKHRLDVKLALSVPEEKLAVAPHGIVGQAWDGDGKAIDGEQDQFPTSGEFTTFAMARGAIEGMPNDYKMMKPYSTEFKFSRFGLEKAAPRDVAKLTAAGELGQPKVVANSTNVENFVGSSEYEHMD